MRRFWIIKAVVGFAVFLFLAGFVAMSLWNWLVPDLFHGPLITYWQAFGLLVLSKMLFGGFGRHGRGGWHGGHWRRNWQEKFEKMTPEQKEEWRKRWEGRCGPGRWNFPQEEKANTI